MQRVDLSFLDESGQTDMAAAGLEPSTMSFDVPCVETVRFFALFVQ
jgi:hypothetical protein